MRSALRPPRLAALALAALCAAAPAIAAPVAQDEAADDVFELALRWTLESTSLGPAAAPPTPQAAVLPARSHAPGPIGAVESAPPDPSSYALMGLLLLAAGLAARRFSGRR